MDICVWMLVSTMFTGEPSGSCGVGGKGLLKRLGFLRLSFWRWSTYSRLRFFTPESSEIGACASLLPCGTGCGWAWVAGGQIDGPLAPIINWRVLRAPHSDACRFAVKLSPLKRGLHPLLIFRCRFEMAKNSSFEIFRKMTVCPPEQAT